MRACTEPGILDESWCGCGLGAGFMLRPNRICLVVEPVRVQVGYPVGVSGWRFVPLRVSVVLLSIGIFG